HGSCRPAPDRRGTGLARDHSTLHRALRSVGTVRLKPDTTYVISIGGIFVRGVFDREWLRAALVHVDDEIGDEAGENRLAAYEHEQHAEREQWACTNADALGPEIRKIGENREPDDEERRADATKKVQWASSVLGEEEERQQIRDLGQNLRRPVLGGAV